MSPKIHISFDELNPCVRKAGMQTENINRMRKIYDHEFLYCRSGKAYMQIAEKKYDITPGTLILISPNKPHNLFSCKEDRADLFWVHFDFVYKPDIQILDELVTNRHSVLYNESLPYQEYIRPEPLIEKSCSFPEHMIVEQVAVVEELFKKIIVHFKEQDVLWRLTCKTLLLDIFSLILRQLQNQKLPSLHEGKSGIAGAVINYVYHNYFRKTNLSDIAKRIGYSEDYVGRIFKSETGESFSKFVTRIRLQKAKELLINTDLSIADIAEVTGFNDIYYFSKVMKKEEGISPLMWKRQFVKNLF